MSLTEDQIIALAPDASSLKAGKDLATVYKWQLRGISDKAMWGHCQGSGKLPYQTQIDLQNIAFKCSCPSRKFPCKHGLGLLLLFASNPESFTKDPEPNWVTAWLDKRTERIGKKTEETNKPVDTGAQAKRADARTRKVSGGMDDIQIWLKDLIRNGLINLPERSHDYWQNPARRMIDAQAPGLSAMVKALGEINYFNDSWKHEVLTQLSRIYLASESYRYLDSLPDNFQQEIKTLVGFTQSKEDILAQQGIKDQWVILARIIEEDEQLTIERNWMYGLNSKRFALILQFFANRKQPELSFMPGTSIHAELVFYRGVHTYRALVKDQMRMDRMILPDFHSNLSDALASFSRIITENPFIDKVPLLLNNVRFMKNNLQDYLMDDEGKSYKVNACASVTVMLLAVTGGRPCQLFVLANESEIEPLAVWASNNFITLSHAV
jgi:hypothetical protein